MAQRTIQSLYFFFSNLIEKWHHTVSPDEIDLLKKTALFDHLTEAQFDRVLQGISLVRYPQDSLLFKEGDTADALYIVKQGSARIFTYGVNGKKVPLARISKGDYFGEQAFISKENKTRNASIEAIQDVTLIKIKAKSIDPYWKNDLELKTRLKKIGFHRAIDAISSSFKIYGDLHPLIEKLHLDERNIVEYKDGDQIFSVNSPADNVYFILQGEVTLIIYDQELEKERNLKLHRGHLFGELGVIENKPRQGSAIAGPNLRLLVIKGKQFKEIYQQYPQLQNLLAEFKKIYQLPSLGLVEQYIGDTPDVGPTLTNIYKMAEGRSIIATRSLTSEIFKMSVTAEEADEKFQYSPEKDKFTTLFFSDKFLVGIENYGDWEDLPIACQLLLNHKKIDKASLKKFTLTGELSPPASDDEILCGCLSITKAQIQKLIDEGIRDLPTLTKKTGICTVCGSCSQKILELLGESHWISATMQKERELTGAVNRYRITLKEPIKEILPGQYITLQVRVHLHTIERSYMVIDHTFDHLQLLIAIKHEPNGLLTDWLFKESSDSFHLKVSQPEGNFILNRDPASTALCLAEGIGITSFISFAHGIENVKKRVHIVYNALETKDFIFTKELNEMAKDHPSLSISYREINSEGFLSSSEITKLIQKLHDPEVYVSGSELFVKAIDHILQAINYDSSKIFNEPFVHAGFAP